MKKLFAMLACTGILALSAVPSLASPILRLSSGGASVTVTDGGAGDAVQDSGAVAYVGSVGNFNLSVTTGLTKPFVGTDHIATMDLNSVSATSRDGGTLRLEFTETGFLTSYDATNFLTQLGGTIANAIGSNLAFKVYVDATNAAFGTATEIFSSTFGPGAFSTSSLNAAALTSHPYSMTIVASLTHAGAGVSSFDGFVQVPEPATGALLGIGLLGIGLVRRRRANHPLS